MSKFEREFKATVEAFWKEEQAKPEKPIFGGDDWKVALFL